MFLPQLTSTYSYVSLCYSLFTKNNGEIFYLLWVESVIDNDTVKSENHSSSVESDRFHLLIEINALSNPEDVHMFIINISANIVPSYKQSILSSSKYKKLK